jgi:hypothetical protein
VLRDREVPEQAKGLMNETVLRDRDYFRSCTIR